MTKIFFFPLLTQKKEKGFFSPGRTLVGELGRATLSAFYHQPCWVLCFSITKITSITDTASCIIKKDKCVLLKLLKAMNAFPRRKSTHLILSNSMTET